MTPRRLGDAAGSAAGWDAGLTGAGPSGWRFFAVATGAIPLVGSTVFAAETGFAGAVSVEEPGDCPHGGC